MTTLKHFLFACALLACSLGAQAQTSGERCVGDGDYVGTPPTGYNDYSAAGGTTGYDKNAEGDPIGGNNIAVGMMSSANGANNVALGVQAHAEGTDSIAIGTRANATADGAVAIGNDAQATRCYATAVGNSSQATGARSTATGLYSTASGSNSTATGAFATASGVGSTATGDNAQATAYGSTANGANARATAVNSTANGFNAQATHTNSVALGANSRTTRPNEVNVGGRQIGGVNDATLGTDAVNLRQMQAADAWTLTQANRYSDLGDIWTLNQAKHYTDERVKGLHKRIDRTSAMNTAMSMMTGSAAAIPGKSKMAVGMGFSNGEPALAIGYQRAWLTKKNRPMALTIGAAFARQERSVGLGLAWGLK